ncbi:site-specific integrase [uncultured Sneathia sp.]|uniref:site-specific integrase n=1 Tax=uncultured Sneathia sp. TaxID=278067 RepID=UPI00259485CF|nr:site-specific integrase [uncultured Sneathia sp.]
MASLKMIEKGNWEVSFYCKQYNGENKKIKKRGFLTKKEASEYATNYIKMHTGAIDTMFFDIVDEFIDYKQDKIKYNTKINYKKVQKKIHELFENKPINQITKGDIARFLDKLKHIPSQQKEVKQKINLIFKYASVYYNLNYNPMDNLEYELAKSKPKIKEILTLEEFKKLDEILKKEVKPLARLYYNLMYYSGARPGEIAGLTLNDIDFNNCTININKTRIRTAKVNSPKNSSSNRIVTLPKKCIEMLKKVVNLSLPKKEFIFSTPIVYCKCLIRIIKEYNFPKKISLHSFRHSHVSLLIEQGVEITSISQRIGHKNSQVTLGVYAHFYKKKNDKILDILNKID